jgi:hypothetical protein
MLEVFESHTSSRAQHSPDVDISIGIVGGEHATATN